ncbi:DUF4082 domain-containing protein [Rhodovulum sp. DZ06]|uniref:DUF4082 domain-containing protein n=1 Tax=Rhodovulum sp. DZ06 TaxID=3425126 RepID=UPI003D332A28
MRFTVSAAAMLAALALPGAASAISMTQTGLGEVAADGAGTDSDEYGWRFTANADLLVTELGFFASTPATGFMNLWDASTQSLITTVTATATATGWIWGEVASPALLTEGDSYVVSFNAGSNNASYVADGGYSVNSLLTFEGTFFNGFEGVYPSIATTGGIFLADIAFQVVDTPLPGAAGFALLGLGALGLVGRRKA